MLCAWSTGSLLAVALVAGAGACDSSRDSFVSTANPHTRNRPTSCSPIEANATLQSAVDRAKPGESLCLANGRYSGPVIIGKPGIRLWGSPRAVIVSTGSGTTVHLKARDTALLGLTVDGSGRRYDLLDAAVHVTADDVRVEGVTVKNAVFGLLLEKVYRATLRFNLVLGPDSGPLGMRGDGIRLWETRQSFVGQNRLVGSRDMVVWYSSGNRFVANTVARGRYGTHFMYSHENRVEDNRYIDNVVGIFAMYSRNLTLKRNLIARSHGAGGMGLGVKESGNLSVEDNRFISNTVGVYLDTSPLEPGDRNRFSRNTISLSQTGVVFHSSQRRNTFADNRFADNQLQVEVAGGGDALGVKWRRNDFDDYIGYDMDNDGYGDVPYTLRRLSSQLQSRFPGLAFFRGSATLALLDAMSELFPLFKPRTILRDPRPRLGPTPSVQVEIAREGPPPHAS